MEGLKHTDGNWNFFTPALDDTPQNHKCGGSGTWNNCLSS